MENQHDSEVIASSEQIVEGSNVRLFVRPAITPHREPPATPDELAQYRALLPRLIRAVEIVERLVAPSGCPVARSVLDLDD